MKRDFELAPSKENTREIEQPRIIKFDLDQIKQHFDNNINEINRQFDVAETLIKSGKYEDASNIWRYQIVFLESAFDFYLHEITKFGLSNIFENQWEKTDKYLNIGIELGLIEKVLHGNVDKDWFDIFINKNYSSITMLSFENFKNQMNLIGIEMKAIADYSFYNPNSSEKTLDKMKVFIDEIYRRRNEIAHQSDRKHNTAEKNSISKSEVKNSIEMIVKIVDGIHSEVLKKQPRNES